MAIELGASADGDAGAGGGLPELAAVPWRARVTERSLRRTGWLWTFTTVAHTIPFLGAAGLLFTINPITVPIGVIVLAHAWAIPELYAARGANVVRLRGPAGRDPELRALLLLGDLVDDRARELHGRTGLVLERGGLGTWLIGEAGAVLVRPGGRRVCCYCVRVTDRALPSCDKVAHLLLAVRADEAGFATVANLAFSGARWRLRRRLQARARVALDAAAARPPGTSRLRMFIPGANARFSSLADHSRHASSHHQLIEGPARRGPSRQLD